MLDAKLTGKTIKELRQKKGVTQTEFANKLSVSFQAISSWERGLSLPDIENLMLIASYFGVSVDSLLRPGEELFLGIDGGGTKTEFALVSSDGKIIKKILKNGCNPNDNGYQNTFSIINEGISAILAEFPSVKTVFCGIAGITTGNYRQNLHDELSARYPQLKINIKNDSANLFAMDDSADMTVISGTGSVVFVKKGENYVRLGGWGHLLDRAGSAYDIGRDAIRIALEEEDKNAPRSILGKTLCNMMKSQKVWDNIDAIYTNGKPYIASFASAVFDAYKLGDHKAEKIIDDTAKALANLLNSGVELYGAKPIAIASGGMFEHFEDIMCRHIQKYSNVKLIITGLPPVYGACRNACALSGNEVPEEFYVNFKNSYGG